MEERAGCTRRACLANRNILFNYNSKVPTGHRHSRRHHRHPEGVHWPQTTPRHIILEASLLLNTSVRGHTAFTRTPHSKRQLQLLTVQPRRQSLFHSHWWGHLKLKPGQISCTSLVTCTRQVCIHILGAKHVRTVPAGIQKGCRLLRSAQTIFDFDITGTLLH